MVVCLSSRLEDGSTSATSFRCGTSSELGREEVPVEIFDRAKVYEHQGGLEKTNASSNLVGGPLELSSPRQWPWQQKR